jgi:DNA-binding ferritin-like protein
VSETPGRYTRDDGTLFNKQKSPAEATAQAFVEGIQAFHWRVDYVKFCEVLRLEADEYADQKYRAFQELVERLNEFDAEALAKMMDWGNPKR